MIKQSFLSVAIASLVTIHFASDAYAGKKVQEFEMVQMGRTAALKDPNLSFQDWELEAQRMKSGPTFRQHLDFRTCTKKQLVGAILFTGAVFTIIGGGTALAIKRPWEHSKNTTSTDLLTTNATTGLWEVPSPTTTTHNPFDTIHQRLDHIGTLIQSNGHQVTQLEQQARNLQKQLTKKEQQIEKNRQFKGRQQAEKEARLTQERDTLQQKLEQKEQELQRTQQQLSNEQREKQQLEQQLNQQKQSERQETCLKNIAQKYGAAEPELWAKRRMGSTKTSYPVLCQNDMEAEAIVRCLGGSCKEHRTTDKPDTLQQCMENVVSRFRISDPKAWLARRDYLKHLKEEEIQRHCGCRINAAIFKDCFQKPCHPQAAPTSRPQPDALDLCIQSVMDQDNHISGQAWMIYLKNVLNKPAWNLTDYCKTDIVRAVINQCGQQKCPGLTPEEACLRRVAQEHGKDQEAFDGYKGVQHLKKEEQLAYCNGDYPLLRALECLGIDCPPIPSPGPVPPAPHPAPDVGRFNIQWNLDKASRDHQNSFDAAATRLERMIPGHEDMPFDFDLHINVMARSLPGGMLAQAGPNALFQGTRAPSVGHMRIDPNTFYSHQLEETIMHETFHILTLMRMQNFIDHRNPRAPVFTGRHAVAEYSRLTGRHERGVPMQQGGAHLSEWHFGRELNTPSINRGENPLSRLSLAILQDLGWRVDMAQAEHFSLFQRFAAHLSGQSDGTTSVIDHVDFEDVETLDQTLIHPDGSRGETILAEEVRV